MPHAVAIAPNCRHIESLLGIAEHGEQRTDLHKRPDNKPTFYLPELAESAGLLCAQQSSSDVEGAF